MIDVAVRLVAAWLAHSTYGANAIAQALPRARFNSLEVDDAPPVVAIYNDADDALVAKNFEPPSVPALIVWGDSSADGTVRGYRIAKDVVIGCAYVTDDAADDMTANRECGYLMRAAKLSMAYYAVNRLAHAYRNLNEIAIVDVARVAEERATGASGRFRVWGFLAIHLAAVDAHGNRVPSLEQSA